MLIKKNIQNGFTLIEILIVIAIIGVLTGFMTANFMGVRQRARDAQRKSDIKQIQIALELYRSDNGIYPPTVSGELLISGGCDAAFSSGSSVYMQKVPCDPNGDSWWHGGDYKYEQQNSGASYRLITCLENTNETSTTTDSDCNNTRKGKAQAFTNP